MQPRGHGRKEGEGEGEPEAQASSEASGLASQAAGGGSSSRGSLEGRGIGGRWRVGGDGGFSFALRLGKVSRPRGTGHDAVDLGGSMWPPL